MQINVEAETTISLSLSVGDCNAILEQRDGEWILTNHATGLYRNLAQGRVNWKEALKRALGELETMQKLM